MTEKIGMTTFEHVQTIPTQHRPEFAPAIHFLVGHVKSVVDNTFWLEIDSANVIARQAVSCVLAPYVGDMVLCSSSSAGLHILHVLTREDNQHSAVISVPESSNLCLEQTNIKVRAENLTTDAKRIRAKSDELHLVARLTNLVTGGMEIVADRLKRICRIEMSTAEDSIRTVENTDTLRTGRMLHEASEVISHRSEIAIIEARGDLRVNGERITMG